MDSMLVNTIRVTFAAMILIGYNVSLFIIDVIVLILRSVYLTLYAVFRVIVKPAKKSLVEEVVLITGGGHGLGREMALEFARRGVDKIIIWDINQEGCQQTANDVKKAGGKGFAYYCDVTDREAVKNMAQQVNEDVGPVTILVNNAGIMPAQPFLNTNIDQVRQVMEINTMSHFWTLREFLPKMMQIGRGHVLAISSMAGRVGLNAIVPYCTSKFAVAGLMEGLYEEFRYNKSYPNLHFTTAFPCILNTGFCKNPRLKYPWLCPITEPDVAAKKIIDALQRNEEHVYIPATYEYMYRLSHILPRQVHQLLADFIDAGVNPDIN